MPGNLLKIVFILFLCGISFSVFSQNVGINTTGASPSSNAILDLSTGNAKNTGILIPRVLLGASLSTFNPPMAHAPTGKDSGMMVYNYAATNQATGYYCWNGSSWALAGGEQQYYTTNDTTEKSTTSSTYQNVVSLSVSPGKYIIKFSAYFANNHYDDGQTPDGTWYNFTDGTTIFANSVANGSNTIGEWIGISVTTTMTYTSNTTLYLQYMEYANNSYKAYIKNAAITAVRIN